MAEEIIEFKNTTYPLYYHYDYLDNLVDTPPCGLECKCIRLYKVYFATKGDENAEIKANDVSNSCLKILGFLLRSGNADSGADISDIYVEAQKSRYKQLGPDDIMLTVLYPIYERLFGEKYRNERRSQNYTDPFIYNQILDFKSRYWYDDENEVTCYDVDYITDAATMNDFCKHQLSYLTDRWQKLINVMSFPWSVGMGSMVAHFSYLLEVCDGYVGEYFRNGYDYNGYFREHEELWASLENNGCAFYSNKAVQFHKELEAIAPAIFKQAIPGLSLIDLIGILGYSTTFDLTSLTENDFFSVSKELLPLYGFDRADDQRTLMCSIGATFGRWANYIKDTDTLNHQGNIRV